jgi:hypothetical protein
VSDSPALHSKWLLLLKIEISLVVNFCFITNQKELKRILQKYDLEDKSEAIYNIDEKGLPTEHKPPDIVTGKNSGGQ